MSRQQKVIAAAIVVLAAALRFYGITAWSLNNDEIAEVRWSSGTFAETIAEVRRDKVHPPLDYFVQFAIGKTGAPEWIRRLPSVLCGIASVALAIFLGTRWYSPGAGLVAGFLMSISVNLIRYSQEVRPYSMAFFWIFAAMAALEMYAETRRRGWAIAWFVAVFLSGATLYLAGLVAGVASLMRIFLDCKDALQPLWRRLPVVVLAWTILYSPWLGVVIGAARSQPPQHADTLDWPWWIQRLQNMGTGDWRYEPLTPGSWAFWGAVALGMVVSLRRRILLSATAWLVVGGALSILALQLRPHYSHPRYLFPAWLGAFLLAGAGVAFLWRWVVTKPVAAAIVILFAGYTAITLQTYYRGERSDWRGIAEYVHGRVRPGETVILANNWVIRNFGYYWQRLPRREGVVVERFVPSSTSFAGPAWIVTGQCLPREPLRDTVIVKQYPMSELAEVRYVRPGTVLPMQDELCPE
jgi:mannosyltransferase